MGIIGISTSHSCGGWAFLFSTRSVALGEPLGSASGGEEACIRGRGPNGRCRFDKESIRDGTGGHGTVPTKTASEPDRSCGRGRLAGSGKSQGLGPRMYIAVHSRDARGQTGPIEVDRSRCEAECKRQFLEWCMMVAI